jgi:hypothetical protein
MINRLLIYLVQRGLLPRVYENITEVQTELKPKKLRLKIMERGAIWRTINHRTGEVDIDGIKEPVYHIWYSPVLEALMRFLIVLTLLNTIYNIIVNGLVFQDIGQGLMLSGFFLVAAANVRFSIIILFVFGGMPFFVILYFMFYGDSKEANELLIMTKYGLIFIVNFFFLICSWLVFRNRYKICIVYPDEKKGVYVKYGADTQAFFGV